MNPYLWICLVPAAISAALGTYAWRRRDRHDASALLFVSTALTVWSLGYAMELWQSGLPWKLLWTKVEYLGIATVPLAWLLLALSFTRSIGEVPRKALAALAIVPLLTILLAWTNSWHGLMWTQAGLHERGLLSVAVFRPGIWGGVHVAYSYALLFGASALLLRSLILVPANSRQVFALIAAAGLPWLANLAHLTGASPLYPLDATPLAFTLSGVAVAVCLRRYRFLDLVPVARTTVVDGLCDAILVLDRQGRLIDLNPAAALVAGEEVATLIGRQVSDVFPSSPTLLEAIAAGGEVTGELPLGPKGRERRFAMHVVPLTEPGGKTCGTLVDLHDITDLRAAEARVQFLAYRDSLTGLPNRELFRDRFEQALAVARRTGTHAACLFLDLDDFKKVNDHYGHSVGDEVLREASQRITHALRDSDTVARIPDASQGPTLARFGGDEFVILLQGLSRPAAAAVAADRVVAQLRRPFRLGSSLVSVRTSIGIAISPQDGNSVEVLLRNADAAMYAAKKQGGDSVQFFTRAINDQVRARIEIESDLHNALACNQLALEYQPQVDAASGRVLTLEALVRWDHPRRGRMSPGEFMPIAEESGLIVAVGDWVLERALADWQALRTASPGCRIALNLSARQIGQPGVAEGLKLALERAGVPATEVEIELTEGALMRDTELTQQVLEALRADGIRIAIDDFGSGSSSLGYMRTFPLDLVKIDSSFTTRIDDARSASLVRAIIALAHELGLDAVAEGVESQAQLDFLRDEGCDRVQGYLLSEPLGAQEAAELLGRRVVWPKRARATA